MVEQGTLEQFDDFFKQIRPAVRLPFLTVAGNHDLGKDQDLTLYREIFGPDYYAFQLKDNYFIVVNDGSSMTGIGEAQVALAGGGIKANPRPTKPAWCSSIPPSLTPGGVKITTACRRPTGRRLAALFRQYRVSHIFAGHIHSYFTGDWDGVPYTITGGAGAPLYGTDPKHFFYHYLKVTLQEGEVHVEVQRIKAEGDH